MREFLQRVTSGWVPEQASHASVDQQLLTRQAHRTIRQTLFLVELLRGIDLRADRQQEVAALLRRIRSLMSVVRGDAFESKERKQRWQQLEQFTRALDLDDPALASSIDDKRYAIAWLHGGMRAYLLTGWPPANMAATFFGETLLKNIVVAAGLVLFSCALWLAEPVRALFFDDLAWFAVCGAIVGWPFAVFPAAVGRLRARRSVALPPWALAGIFWPLLPRRPEEIDPFPRVSGLVGDLAKGKLAHVGAHLIWLAGCFAAFWWLLHDAADSRLTVGWSACLIAAALLAAHSIDFQNWVDPQHTRSATLIALAIGTLVYQLQPESASLLWVPLALATGAAIVWQVWPRPDGRWDWLRRRLPPLLLCLAAALVLFRITSTLSGEAWSEPHAAVFTRLESGAWPHRPPPPTRPAPVVVLAGSGGGSRAALYVAHTLRMLLALCPNDQPRCEVSIGRHLQLISSVSGGSLASAGYLARLLRGESVDTLADAVTADFLLPVLDGALWPGTSRGASIEAAWRRAEGVALGDITLGELADRWRQGTRGELPPLPIPIFNSATLDGHAVAITPLRWESYTAAHHRVAIEHNLYDALDPASEHTWVYYRTGVYGLENFLQDYDPLLASAVRASANFPFGFPLVQIRTRRPQFFSPLAKERTPSHDVERVVELTDGGVVSNSGMWTLYQLMLNAVSDLRDRGVLVVMVDASKMPSYQRGLWATIGNQDLIARNLHRRMIEALRLSYRDHDSERIAFVEIDLPPEEQNNTYTSWALDRQAKARLTRTFAAREPRWGEEIRSAWQTLAAHEPHSEQAELPRVPSD